NAWCLARAAVQPYADARRTVYGCPAQAGQTGVVLKGRVMKDECMDKVEAVAELPEHNMTGVDFSDRKHFRYAGPPIIDIPAHVLQTRPTDPPNGPPIGSGAGASLEAAQTMLEVAHEFGVSRVYSMCFPDDIQPLRERFGSRIGFNGSIYKKLEEP